MATTGVDVWYVIKLGDDGGSDFGLVVAEDGD